MFIEHLFQRRSSIALLFPIRVFGKDYEYWFKFFGIFLFYLISFGGHYSFTRFFSEPWRIEWLELRLWGTICAIATVICCSVVYGKRLPVLNRQQIISVLMPFVFSCVLLLNLLFIGNLQVGAPIVVDMFFFWISIFLIFFFFQSPAEAELVILCNISQFAGILLFVFALFGFGNPDLNGVCWAPFGGPITFCRVELFAYLSSLYLITNIPSLVKRSLHIIVAIISLFCVMASLLKAAFLGIVLILLFNVYWFLVFKRYKELVTIIAIFIISFLAFAFSIAPKLVTRVNAVMSTVDIIKEPVNAITDTGNILVTNDLKKRSSKELENMDAWFPASVLNELYNGQLISFYDLTPYQQKKIEIFSQLLEYPIPNNSQELTKFLENISNLNFLLIREKSDRSNLLLEAWRNFTANKLYGIGIGNYQYYCKDRYLKKINKYSHSHNIIFDLLSCTGLLGTSVFVVLIFISLVFFQKAILYSKKMIYFVSYGLFILFTAMFSGSYNDFRWFWYVLCFISLFYNQATTKPQLYVRSVNHS